MTVSIIFKLVECIMKARKNTSSESLKNLLSLIASKQWTRWNSFLIIGWVTRCGNEFHSNCPVLSFWNDILVKLEVCEWSIAPLAASNGWVDHFTRSAHQDYSWVCVSITPYAMAFKPKIYSSNTSLVVVTLTSECLTLMEQSLIKNKDWSMHVHFFMTLLENYFMSQAIKYDHLNIHTFPHGQTDLTSTLLFAISCTVKPWNSSLQNLINMECEHFFQDNFAPWLGIFSELKHSQRRSYVCWHWKKNLLVNFDRFLKFNCKITILVHFWHY